MTCRARTGQGSGLEPSSLRQDWSVKWDSGHRWDPGPVGKVPLAKVR